MTDFAPPLGQSAPVAQSTTGYKDSSPHFEHIDALSAIIGTVVSQLFQAGAPFSDTLGTFRPIVIGSNGVTVNTSGTHPSTLRFHATDVSATDILAWVLGFAASTTKNVVWGREDSTNTTVLYDWQNTDGTVSANTAQLHLTVGGTPLQLILSSIVAGVSNPIFASVDGKVGGGTGVIVNRVKAGAPVDGDFTAAMDGMGVVDSTNNRWYVRHGGAWHFVALT